MAGHAAAQFKQREFWHRRREKVCCTPNTICTSHGGRKKNGNKDNASRIGRHSSICREFIDFPTCKYFSWINVPNVCAHTVFELSGSECEWAHNVTTRAAVLQFSVCRHDWECEGENSEIDASCKLWITNGIVFVIAVQARGTTPGAWGTWYRRPKLE